MGQVLKDNHILKKYKLHPTQDLDLQIFQPSFKKLYNKILLDSLNYLLLKGFWDFKI